MGKEKTSRLIAQNKKAYHDYFIEETYQAGIALAGTEVKSLRLGKCPLRTRRLLLHKHEINKISAAVTATGYTVVPLKVYFDHGLVKLDIGIAKGKKLYDKRQTIAKNDQRREAEKEFKIRNLTL